MDSGCLRVEWTYFAHSICELCVQVLYDSGHLTFKPQFTTIAEITVV